MDNNLKLFEYAGSCVSFQRSDAIMINATEMCRAFGKRPAKWLELQSTIDFIDTISSVRNVDTSDLVVAKFGSPQNGGGTWMHEDVALEFARWLSPEFAIWCNDRVKELLTHGITATSSTIDDILANPDNGIKLLNALKQERKEKAILKEQNKLQQEVIQASTSKVNYYENVLQSNETYTFTQMAKELNFRSCVAFTTKLKEMKIVFRQSRQWLLAARFASLDYTKTRTHTYLDEAGRAKTNTITVWTEKGRLFLHNILK